MLNIGALNKRVTLQTQSTTQDATGQPLTTWADSFTAWASIKHQSGSSAIKSGADTSSVKCSIRIRYRAGINAGMRVKHGGTFYSIEAVLPDQNRAHVDLVCGSVNGQL